ncbi:P-loop containing nucleoside triphosphate hydrolase [Sesbania bispinosa]|nr:P-loop containing nucleoside triphosphate hydrolase [Sesbania bispinosa]KAJ1413534.1 P-loop containing nucleoside triphosphate hydrolase [Sesbania bispinosa]
MAVELVCGALLSSSFQVAFERLASREVLDFFRGRKLNEELLNKLNIKLLSINAVLDDAEQRQIRNPNVKAWLVMVKDAVFEAEDLLDEIDTHVSKSKLKPKSRSITSKVRNIFVPPLSSFHKGIDSRMQKVLDKLEYLAKEKDILGLKEASVGSGSQVSQKMSSTSLLISEAVIYGRDVDKENIFNWLVSNTENDNNQLSVISIVGMGGLGKTTLAQHLYNDPRMKFEIRAWVCVSDEFDVFKVTRAILEAITGSTDDSIDLNMVHGRLKEKLTGKKFLLVLDDVWNEKQDQWEALQTPLTYGAQGSKILVTTRSLKVASTMRSTQTHQLQELQEEHCQRLFAKHAFQNENSQIDHEFKEIGMKIIKKCKGLPLALKTIGSLLKTKTSLLEWESILTSEIWDLPEGGCNIIPALILSYHHLPPHLKRCFAYCSLFPKDYLFQKEDLILLWMAENFLQQGKSMIAVGEEYFNDLLSRSFFQQSREDEMRFVMHDLLNDLAKYVSGDFCCRLDVEVRMMPKQFGKLKNLQVLSSFYVGKDTESNIKELGELNLHGRLEILELQNVDNPLDALAANMKSKTHLVELELEWSEKHEDSEKEREVLEKLQPSKHLKELSIWKYGGKQFPDWFWDNSLLSSLTLVDCKYCTSLPPLGLLPTLKELSFKGLSGIKVIGAEFYGYGSSSSSIIPFRSLETLKFEDMEGWEEWKCNTVKGAFPRLRKLYIRKCPQLKGQLVEQLWGGGSCVEGSKTTDDPTINHCHNFLETLHIASLKCALAINTTCLRELRIDISGVDVESFPDEGLLPLSLTSLFIIKCPNLKKLDYKGLRHLSSLKELSLHDCPSLECLPEEGLPKSISTLHIWDCSSLLKQRCQNPNGEDWGKISHIDDVDID